MRTRPVSPSRLVEEIADHAVAAAGLTASGRARVAIDGADPARPDVLADALVDPLRLRGHPVVRVRAEDHLRPASLRLERGRTDPDSFFDDWLDVGGLRREVLDPLAGGGDARIRPTRWDAVADRASRAGFVAVPPAGIVIVSGPLLLGRGLAFDLTVHLALSTGALARRTPPDLAWTLPAFDRYAEQVDPSGVADIVVRADDAAHPAVYVRSSRF